MAGNNLLLISGAIALFSVVAFAIPTQPPCKFPVDCLGLPCVYKPFCDGHPDAVCVPDSCGCKAKYYVGEQEVECGENTMPWAEIGRSEINEPAKIDSSAESMFTIKYECPVIKPSQLGLCMSNCANDADCGTTRKCCSNGCGKVCVDGVLPKKLGSCPSLSRRGPCFLTCKDHAHCEGSKLCCANGCGMECKESVFN